MPNNIIGNRGIDTHTRIFTMVRSTTAQTSATIFDGPIRFMTVPTSQFVVHTGTMSIVITPSTIARTTTTAPIRAPFMFMLIIVPLEGHTLIGGVQSTKLRAAHTREADYQRLFDQIIGAMDEVASTLLLTNIGRNNPHFRNRGRVQTLYEAETAPIPTQG
jgi:hypothetical protein